MDKKLARRNLRTALIATAVILFMFGMSWVAAYLYIGA
jgi:hypothetical protein